MLKIIKQICEVIWNIFWTLLELAVTGSILVSLFVIFLFLFISGCYISGKIGIAIYNMLVSLFF